MNGQPQVANCFWRIVWQAILVPKTWGPNSVFWFSILYSSFLKCVSYFVRPNFAKVSRVVVYCKCFLGFFKTRGKALFGGRDWVLTGGIVLGQRVFRMVPPWPHRGEKKLVPKKTEPDKVGKRKIGAKRQNDVEKYVKLFFELAWKKLAKIFWIGKQNWQFFLLKVVADLFQICQQVAFCKTTLCKENTFHGAGARRKAANQMENAAGDIEYAP